MPADTGMAFVLIQHLDPEHPSALVELIRRSTAMDVFEARSGMAVGPNQVFVIPPDAVLTIQAGILSLARPPTTAARRVAVNTFLISLAEDQEQDAVGIILAGFGADGALGVEAIKEHGGLTLAQAGFDHAPKSGMPQSAASGGHVDHVLPAAGMPQALIDYLRFRAETDGAKGPDGVGREVVDRLGAICAVMNSRLGKDFSQYKTNTLMRRVQRRMQVLQLDSVSTYIEHLREQPNEPELLFREVLIRVTRFFRDASAFDALASRIPAMLAHGEPQDTIRVWVAGCATGEEAYSVAILFKEAMARATRPRKVQIFATDIDDQAIEIARTGVYPETIASDVPEDLLERHFQKEGERWRVSKDIRQMCLFSQHDLVKDPPFSKLDLVSCRNLLIYFGPALQKRVIAMFHYGLLPGGLLFLGSSEAVTAHVRLFAPLDKKHRLFERRDVPAQLMAATANPSRTPPAEVSTPLDEGRAEPQIARIIARYAPAFVIIDRRHNVQQFSGPIAKYLEPAIGTAGLSLPGLIHPDLRASLRSALKQTAATNRRVILENLVLEVSGRREATDLIVEPLVGPEADGLLLVGFRDLGPVRSAEVAMAASADALEAGAADELVAARERLQTLTEELETSNEELQSSNEEYQSVNEELQSANEELETSKEELQSINEELSTINAELNLRNENLTDLNSDLANLIDSTSIATLFLDRDFRIRRFTPPVIDIFNVRSGDEGRPVTDIVSHLAQDGLLDDVRRVMRTLIPVDREVGLIGAERIYQMQVRPYRDVNDVINGVVITFVDISASRSHEVDRAKLAAIIDSSDDAIFSNDPAGVITGWNAGAQAIYGYAPAEVIGQPMAMLVSGAQAADWPAILKRLMGGEAIHHFDWTHLAKDGRVLDISMTLSPIRSDEGKIIGVSAIGRDISERKHTERKAALLLGELDHRVKNILAIVSSVVAQTLKSAATPAEFAVSMEGRIRAIAKAHNLLTGAGEAGVSLHVLIATELAPYDGAPKRVKVLGDDITLTPRAGLPIAMAIHELTTNAAKHGALSQPGGRLLVSWEVTGGGDAPVLEITWTESGGPPVAPNPPRGFGTTLIEKTLAYQFSGKVDRVFAASGLSCVINLPLTDDLAQPNSDTLSRGRTDAAR